MPLYIGQQKVGPIVGTSSPTPPPTPTDENLVRDWVTDAIDLSNLTSTDLNAIYAVRQLGLAGSHGVSSLTLPNCTYVANRGFASSQIQYLNLPMCDWLEYSAFSEAYNLIGIQIPLITSIPSNCFANCSNLQTIDLSNVTSINSQAFNWCTSLETANTQNVTHFYDYCFYGCENLESINISSGIYFYYECFGRCTKLKQLDFSSNTMGINQYICNQCTGLEKIWIPSTASYIGWMPFYGVNPKCVIYTDLPDENSIPSNWSYNWDNYNDYSKLTVIYGATHENFVNGTLPTFPYTLTINAPQDCVVKITYMNVEQTTNTITMKENTTATYKIEKTGYMPYTGTVTMETSDITINFDPSVLVELPKTLNITYDNAGIGDNPAILSTLIDNYNFELNLDYASIVNGPKTHYVSDTCESHGYIVVCPDKTSQLTVVQRISSEQSYDFGGVYVDTQIYEPSWNEVFNGYNYGTGTYLMRRSGIDWTPMTYTMVLEKDTTYYLNFFYVKDGGSSGIDMTLFDLIKVEPETEIDIFEQIISNSQVRSISNSDVTSIPRNMFCGCGYIETIDLPNVTICGDSAFSQCSALRSINIPKLTEATHYCVANDSVLQSLDLPDVVTIRQNAFQHCNTLRKIWLSNKCTTIDPTEGWNSPFYGDTNVTLYTDLPSAPVGWGTNWNVVDDNGNTINVVWNATHTDFENA